MGQWRKAALAVVILRGNGVPATFAYVLIGKRKCLKNRLSCEVDMELLLSACWAPHVTLGPGVTACCVRSGRQLSRQVMGSV